jgi:hypothetical protein
VQGSGRPPDERLAGHPDMDPPADLLLIDAGVVGGDQGAGVVLGLQQAGDELGFVPGQLRGGFLQADVDVEALGDDVAVGRGRRAADQRSSSAPRGVRWPSAAGECAQLPDATIGRHPVVCMV